MKIKLAQFMRFAEVHGVSEVSRITEKLAEEWIWAPTLSGLDPSPNTRHQRRWILRFLFKRLRHAGSQAGDPTLDIEIGTWAPRERRPLSDTEMLQVRHVVSARPSVRALVIVALSEATATIVELANLVRGDLDLDLARVRLPGSKGVFARTAQLTEWGQLALIRLVDTWPHDAPLATSSVGNLHARLSAVGHSLDKPLMQAFLRHLPGVQRDSIRLWAGMCRYQESGLRAAATVLGLRSLDRTAQLLGIEQE